MLACRQRTATTVGARCSTKSRSLRQRPNPASVPPTSRPSLTSPINRAEACSRKLRSDSTHTAASAARARSSASFALAASSMFRGSRSAAKDSCCECESG